MPTGKEMVTDAQQSMSSVTAQQVHQELDDGQSLVVLDVREKEEWDEGHISRATHLSRGRLEGRVEEMIPDKKARIVCH